MNVQEGRVVTLEYTVRLANGQVVDSTGTCGPVSIMHGSGQLFPGLDDRIAGMRPGETREIRIPPDEAYGERRPELVRKLPRDRIPPELDLEVGRDYRLTMPEGKVLRFRVLSLTKDSVEADFNAPTAGQELLGAVTVISVRAATPAEERRGRV